MLTSSVDSNLDLKDLEDSEESVEEEEELEVDSEEVVVEATLETCLNDFSLV